MPDDVPSLDSTELCLTLGARLEQFATPIWVHDAEHLAIVWANRAALEFWHAESLEQLAERNLRAQLTPGIVARFDQHHADLRGNPEITKKETWTLYPGDAPTLTECALHTCPLPGAREGILVEARPQPEQDDELLRCIDALLHSEIMTGLYDEAGVELFANRSLREIAGAGPRRFGDGFIDRTMMQSFMSGLAGTGQHRETVAIRSTGGKRWLDMQAVRCRDAATGKAAFQVSATDITVTYMQERKLRAARDAALSADRAKSEFVAKMSHEMRTPLNGILGMVELLSFSKLDDRQASQLEIIRDSGKALLALIEDVLDLSSLEIRAITPVKEPFDLHQLAAAVIGGLVIPAKEKGLSLRYSIAPDVPNEGIGDARRLAQLMRNLIANAIKFTHRGGIDLMIGREGKSTLRIDVIDTGPGVPPEQQSQIFQKFHQLEQSRSAHDGSVGLGLAICHELVSLFGGEIGVENAPAGGAQFWFTVPDVLANSHYIHRRSGQRGSNAA